MVISKILVSQRTKMELSTKVHGRVRKSTDKENTYWILKEQEQILSILKASGSMTRILRITLRSLLVKVCTEVKQTNTVLLKDSVYGLMKSLTVNQSSTSENGVVTALTEMERMLTGQAGLTLENSKTTWSLDKEFSLRRMVKRLIKSGKKEFLELKFLTQQRKSKAVIEEANLITKLVLLSFYHFLC